MSDTIVIGVAGGTGSGKTTLVDQIRGKFGSNVVVMYHDSYYRAHDELTYEQRAGLNYDCPEAFETDLLTEHLRELKAGRPVEAPTYDYTAYNRAKETVTVFPAKVIVVEGILIFCDAALRRMMDIKIFVDTDADVRILRRLVRDVKERGRTIDSVVAQYLTTVKPMHEQYVEPSRRYADIVVPAGGRNMVAIDMIMSRISRHLEESGKNGGE